MWSTFLVYISNVYYLIITECDMEMKVSQNNHFYMFVGVLQLMLRVLGVAAYLKDILNR